MPYQNNHSSVLALSPTHIPTPPTGYLALPFPLLNAVGVTSEQHVCGLIHEAWVPDTTDASQTISRAPLIPPWYPEEGYGLIFND